MSRYRYYGVFPNQEISPKAGAYHSSEIPLLFGTTEDTGKDTPSETKLARNMRHAWAEFAKDPVNGLVKLGWPVYNQNGELIPRFTSEPALQWISIQILIEVAKGKRLFNSD